MAERFPMDIPYGWFFISYADELAPGEVKTVHYFDEELVLFRTKTGKAGLMEAYCAHLGAHLGHGGTVDGETLRCPFHAWAYDTQGWVKDVPYAKKLPPITTRRPCMKAYPITEKNNVIWAWYHPEKVEPFFDVIEHEEIGADDWEELDRYYWVVHSNPQEIAENGVDIAHFRYVHGMDDVPEGHTTYDRHIRHSIAEGQRTLPMPDGEMKTFPTKVVTVQSGAGQKYTRITGITDTLLMVLVTPITKEKIELRFAFTHRKFDKESMEYNIARMAIALVIGQTGVEGDIPIWNHKIHRKNPILCDGDGPIMPFREYFEQFYLPAQQREAAE
ncbi:Rieske (2Fe-2S) protein [Oleomonas cavernae]|uniref:cholesterol 7-desaturase n=1 Tax=Oleomonas cavernae TaxID=2320859 RepID=A0A418WFL6_9PROT|nr:Rieske 2Fe-2S domain-containing protein [Oleomonas cavernae]RJF88808.1 Rieske (2Fe-2S) protein [Oleomonas cavernae]